MHAQHPNLTWKSASLSLLLPAGSIMFFWFNRTHAESVWSTTRMVAAVTRGGPSPAEAYTAAEIESFTAVIRAAAATPARLETSCTVLPDGALLFTVNSPSGTVLGERRFDRPETFRADLEAFGGAIGRALTATP